MLNSDYKNISELGVELFRVATANVELDKKSEELQIKNDTDNELGKDYVSFRLTKREKSIIDFKSKMAKISMSEYCRKAALGKEIVVIQDIKELVHQVSKIGTNLNQLTILAHESKIKNVDLKNTTNELKEIMDILIDIRKRAANRKDRGG